ncbi:LysR family transcriptional regulator [Natronospirillum operosum]|uniref:LysR family transcriptional regulator n=1 Tax=Natronospirillum operosum TaxID=2759953 RepID=A0A4Z0WD45_9GAMM|nr:LysR family transcriptional regulator [Natronospirillum operosum]TGG95794.1 LysR family transcriptional regulator [Natronospirillum operosum]
MNETMVEWNDLQLFLAVAREGGLSAAAKSTRRSAATLGRRMLALERGMGRDLFVRHDRGYELTFEGRALLESLTEIEPRIYRLTAPARQGTRPLVKVSAGTWTTLHLVQFIDQLTGTPPDLRLRFVSAEAVLDISHREVTIGFRNRRPTEEALVCRKLWRVEFAPYAMEGSQDRWIKVVADTPSARWLERTVGTDAICEVNSPRNSLDLALAGKGIALLPTFIGAAQPQLRRRGGIISELGHDQWLVTHQDDRTLPEVRRAIDRLYNAMEQPDI